MPGEVLYDLCLMARGEGLGAGRVQGKQPAEKVCCEFKDKDG